MGLGIRMRIEGEGHRPKVQVQVVVYNSASYISECLRSIRLQSFPVARLLVIDNSSNDNSCALALEQVSPNDLLALNVNTGYASAHNIGFRLASESGFDYVLTVNPDSILSVDYVEKLVQLALSLDRCGGVTGKVFRMTKAEINCDGLVIDSAGLAMENFLHVRDSGAGKLDGAAYNKTKRVWGVCGAVALYRVDMLRDVDYGGQVFDETFFIYKEDVDLCWRAKRRGWDFWFTPDAVAHHVRGWKHVNHQSLVAASHSFANQVALLIRHSPGLSGWLIVIIVVELARWMRMAICMPKAAIQAACLISTQWGHHMLERRRLQLCDVARRDVLRDLCRPGHI